MSALSRFASLETGAGPLSAYIAEPSDRRRPTILILHEIFGANAAMRAEADRWAEAGYRAVLPDLYWRIAPGTALGYSDAERQLAVELWSRFDVDLAVADIADLTARFRAEGEAVAAIGFCLGGQLALLAGATGDVDAAIAFYPVKMAESRPALRALEIPVLVHLGDDDPHVPPEVMAIIEADLAANAEAQILIHAGTGHGFYNDFRPQGYVASAAAAARAATLGFLQRLPDRNGGAPQS